MKHHIVLLSTLTAVLGSAIFSPSVNINAQETPQNSLDTQGREIESGSRGLDIPQREVNNDPNDSRPAPPDKDGPRTRGGIYASELRFDNRTPWYIEIYINNEYAGELGPYGDSYIPTTDGRFSLYAVAKFSDGDRYVWGPSSVYLDPRETFTWRLYK